MFILSEAEGLRPQLFLGRLLASKIEDMKLRFLVGVLLVGLAVALAASAYENPLRDYSLREAYFLGRRKDEKTAQFLAQYVKRLPVPKQGPHVAEIELRTPYEQVVLRARNAPDGYSSQQATQEYRKQGDRVVLRVLIYLTPTYPAHTPIGPVQSEPVLVRPEDFWRDFDIRLFQENEVSPRDVRGRPIYTYPEFGLPGLVGAEVELEFEADDLAPSEPARVEILTPDGQRISALFDLEKLR